MCLYLGSKSTNDATNSNDTKPAREHKSTKQHATATTNSKLSKSIAKHSSSSYPAANTKSTKSNDSNATAAVITTTGTFQNAFTYSLKPSADIEVLDREKIKKLQNSNLNESNGKTFTSTVFFYFVAKVSI